MAQWTHEDFKIISTGPSESGILDPDGNRVDIPGELTTRTGNSYSIIQRAIDKHNQEEQQMINESSLQGEIIPSSLINTLKNNGLLVLGILGVGLVILGSGGKR